MIENNIDTVDITIDGKKIKAGKDKNILQAAMDAGMYIPYLCYYPGMKSYGACRMCVVEVEGGRGMPASCTTPVSEGMKINTQTDELVDLRKGIMELLGPGWEGDFSEQGMQQDGLAHFDIHSHPYEIRNPLELEAN